MMKASFICFFVFILCVCSLANTVNIRNYGDFVKLANDAREGNFNCDVVLETDLDFNDDTLKGILDILPLGKGKYQQCVPYNGTFEGNGRHVKNLKLTTNQDSGFLCGVSDATIKNLIIDDSCTFTGSTVGGVSAQIYGSVSLYNVKVHASISPSGTGSGMLGYGCNLDRPINIIVEDSVFDGVNIQADTTAPYFGGFIGCMDGNEDLYLSFERDVANFSISSTNPSVTSSNYGGEIGRLAANTNVIVNMRNNRNDIHWSSVSFGNAGGWIGFASGTNVSLTLENNVNHINLDVSAEIVGGYFGLIQPSTGKLIVKNNTNDGDIFLTGSSASGAGGYIGQMFLTGEFTMVFESNVNNVNLHANLDASYGYFGGFVGQSVVYGSIIHFINNVNNGSFANGRASGINYGGITSFLSVNGESENNPASVRILNNLNTGIVSSYVNSGSGVYLAGLFGLIPSGQYCNVECVNNVNKAPIKAEVAKGTVYVGGVFGQIHSNTDIILRENTNHGSVNVTGSPEGASGLVAGLVGYFSSDTNQITLTDSSNYGDVVGNNLEKNTATCGIICRQASGIINLQNCVNDASVKGTNAFGISNNVSKAHNIVSMGEVSGSNQSFSFWDSVAEISTSVYGLSDKCKNCDDTVTLFAKDSSDGKYHMVSGKKALVNSLLNDEAGKNGYKLRWDDDLHLREQVTVHIGGPSLDVDLTVLSGTPLGDVEELKKYLDSEDYAVGDKDKNEVLDKTSPITSNMSIVVVERHVVVIEIEKGTPAVDVNITELAELISLLTGISKDDILIELVVDENGYILRVLLILPSDELGEVALKSINDMIKAKDKGCTYDILCRAREARILVEGQSISGAGRTIISNGIIVISLFFSLVMMEMK